MKEASCAKCSVPSPLEPPGRSKTVFTCFAASQNGGSSTPTMSEPSVDPECRHQMQSFWCFECSNRTGRTCQTAKRALFTRRSVTIVGPETPNF